MTTTPVPKVGDRYVVLTPFTCGVLVHWRAPATYGYDKELPAGLEFVIDYEPPESATAVSALAEPYEKWERVLVNEEDRAEKKYDGYHLVIHFKDLKQNCGRLS